LKEQGSNKLILPSAGGAAARGSHFSSRESSVTAGSIYAMQAARYDRD